MLEALLSGAAEGLLLIQDSVACEGRSLLKSFITAAVQRAESIHVLSFDLPELEFKDGLSTEVTSQILFHDAFPDPLGWSGKGNGLTLQVFSASELASRLAPTSRGPITLVLDSLSWLLLRLPFPSVCQVLAQLPRRANVAGLKIVRIVALVHGDLHPPAQLDVLKTLACLVVALQPGPRSGWGGEGTPQTAAVLHRKRGSQLLEKTELFSILPGFGFKFLGELPPKGVSREDEAEGRELTEVDPTARLTFNLRLTEAERQARESVPLPYHFSAEKKSSLLQTSTEEGKIYYEPDAADDFDDEDPDDDLDV
ncbi:elongator complex protein 5 isoform X1 [Pseudonaja textilis]|uniref:elongator complex protein 5 isoform X1 n=1 Tax=Pseudonaja textilis TaxID=8673 RepID=UPI000EA95233|nr:elongator complex protein 5 isoform X1 [Pseudonaja textilis]